MVTIMIILPEYGCVRTCVTGERRLRLRRRRRPRRRRRRRQRRQCPCRLSPSPVRGAREKPSSTSPARCRPRLFQRRGAFETAPFEDAHGRKTTVTGYVTRTEKKEYCDATTIEKNPPRIPI